MAHKIGPVQLERLVEEAIATYMPDLAEERRLAKADGRYFTVEQQQVSYAGTAAVHGELDLADALDLEQAVAGLAAQLKDLGSADSLNVRRAAAVGELARHQLALASDRWLRRALRARLETTTRSDRSSSTSTSAGQPSRASGTARLEQGNQLITAGQVRDWCATAGKITVKPVLDLEAHDPVDTDVVPDRHAEITAVAGQDLRLPLVHQVRETLRHRPHHPRRPRRTYLSVQSRAALSGDITGSRPTAAGPTRPSNPATTCGRRSTGTRT